MLLEALTQDWQCVKHCQSWGRPRANWMTA